MNNRTATFLNNRPLLIAGPCSAETELQVFDTCKRLAATGKVNMFRAGIWKPRTKPGMFEGVGIPGLEWMKAVKGETGIPFTVEVATPAHINEALAFDVDVLWIGARTTVNPFSIQALADALKGVNIPVLIKNPVNADIELWSGAIERFQAAGLNKTGMIHRGFSSYGNTEYRNAPMWHLPIEMKRRYPDLPLICDPSHICGNRHMLQQVAQKSIDLDFDGLMLEVHNDPDQAWSDASQQVTPERYAEMINDLQWRKNETENINGLSLLRERIDRIDDELLSLLGERMQIADNIGLYKKENNLTILQAERWNDILNRALAKGNDLRLSKEFMVKYFNAVHMESIDHQNRIMNNKTNSAANEND